jgi:elastin
LGAGGLGAGGLGAGGLGGGGVGGGGLGGGGLGAGGDPEVVPNVCAQKTVLPPRTAAPTPVVAKAERSMFAR